MQIRHAAPTLPLLLAFTGLGAPTLAGSAAAQEPVATPGDSTSVLRGVVLDADALEPLPGVMVRVDTGAETFTSEAGRFELGALEPGTHAVALLTPDCKVSWEEVDLAPGSVLETRFTVTGALPVGERRERDERRRSQGKVVTREEIRRMNARSLAEVIRRVDPSWVGTTAMVGAQAPIRGRSRSSFSEEALEPVVVVDGVRASDGSRMIHSVDAADVALVELLPGSAAGWEYGSDGAAGVIRVTTLKGRMPEETAPTSGCVVPGLPGG